MSKKLKALVKKDPTGKTWTARVSLVHATAWDEPFSLALGISYAESHPEAVQAARLLLHRWHEILMREVHESRSRRRAAVNS